MADPNGMYCLVDGNNFYVSCERVFRPSLNGLPVIVLSNKDGCAVSRSNEAKALGVKMGHWYLPAHRNASTEKIGYAQTLMMNTWPAGENRHLLGNDAHDLFGASTRS